MNVHRWRKLEGSDPELLDLIARYATLQKRLILKTEEVVERDMVVADRDHLCADLKARLASAPGAELVEQLSATQNALSERTRQLKALASEANMFQTQASESKYEVERLTRELLEAKRSMFEAKKKAALVPSARKASASAVDLPSFELIGGSTNAGVRR